jgi:hypothetical protein
MEVQMKRNFGLLFFLSFILLLPACSSSKLTASWVDPEFRRSEVQSIMVLGVAGEDLLRRTFEDEMVAQLRQYGLKAVPSYRSISSKEIPEKEDMEKWIGGQDVDGVMVSRLIGTRQETVVQPGYTTYPGGYGGPYWGRSWDPWVDPYHGWYGYYAGAYDYLYYPPEVYQYEVYVIETTLYLVDSDQPVWSARAEISSRKDMNESIEELVSDLIDNMADKDGRRKRVPADQEVGDELRNWIARLASCSVRPIVLLVLTREWSTGARSLRSSRMTIFSI